MAGSTLVQMAFAGGADESQRAEVLDPMQAFTVVENGRQNKRGGLSKRRGFTNQTLLRLDATLRSAGYKLFAHDKQTCVIDGTTLDAYSPAASCNVNRGRVPECVLEMIEVAAPGVGLSAIVDGVRVGNYYVATFIGGSDSYAVVLDATTGGVVRGPEIIGTSGSRYALLAVCGSNVFAFLYQLSNSTVEYRVLNTASSSSLNTGWASASTAFTDGVSGFVAPSVVSLYDRVAIAYANNSAGTDRLTVRTFDASGAVETQTINTSSVTPGGVGAQGSISDTLWIAWNETTSVKLIGLDADALATTLATTATVITLGNALTNGQGDIDVMSSSTAGAGRVFANDGNGSGRMYMRSFTTSAGAVSASGTTTTVYTAVRSGRVFTLGGRYYALCTFNSTNNQSYGATVCDLSENNAWIRPVAAISPGLALGVSSFTRADVDGSKVWIPVAAISAQEGSYSAHIARLDFASSQRFHHVKHAGKTFLGGGLLSYFDGGRVMEAGFVVRPDAPTTTDSGVAGNPNGAYRYVVAYEHIDGSGTAHTSSISNPSDELSVTSKKITVTVEPLSISARITAATDPAVRIAIYRTASGGEPPYYYLTSLANTLTASTQTYTDNTSDADLIDNATLFAPSLPGVNGGAQDRRAPPGLTYLVSYAGMLVGAEGENVWYSGQDVAGEGTWFNPLFQVPVSGEGDITGLAAQDGTLYAFKRRAIFAIAGEAPSDNGAAGGLGVPRRLAVDVGCIDARSIVTTSLGVFFQSERGIELLTRAQSVTWIGEQVQDTLASYPVCTAATLDPSASLVYFELAASETSNQVSGSGRTLVYDLTLGTWVVDRRWSVAGTADAPAQSAAMIWDGSAYRYAWLETTGYVRPEYDSHLETGDKWVTMKAATGWIKLSGIQGQQAMSRVLLLAKKSTSADVNIALAYDYNDTFEDATTWTADAIDALSSSLARIQIGHDVHDDGEGQAIRVQVSDATPTTGSVGTGEGATWIALTFEGMPRPNAAQLPEEAR